MDKEYYKKYEPLFGAWSITKLLGEGSFGKVYEIEREDFGETYKAALKVVTVPQNESEIKSVIYDGMDGESVAEYFGTLVKEIVSEFVLLSKLKGNSNIVSYEDHQVIPHEGKIGWDILIRMELLTPLMEHAQRTEFSQRDVINLGIDMCKALETCQKRNIIHRDIKPENIFISEDGNFKLGDFGIARTIEKTSSGLSKKGTYTYMAPEVYRGGDYSSNVDIYSLGIVMYRLLNGNRAPFLPAYPEKIAHSDRDNALMWRMSGSKIPAPLNAGGRLAEIVLKACAYNPAERYSSPMQLREELEAIAYNAAEVKITCPQGDKVVIEKNEYASTNDGYSPKTADNYTAQGTEKTESIFAVPPPNEYAPINNGYSPATAVSHAVYEAEKTESAFGIPPARAFNGVAEAPKNKKNILLPIAIAASILMLIEFVFHGILVEKIDFFTMLGWGYRGLAVSILLINSIVKKPVVKSISASLLFVFAAYNLIGIVMAPPTVNAITGPLLVLIEYFYNLIFLAFLIVGGLTILGKIKNVIGVMILAGIAGCSYLLYQAAELYKIWMLYHQRISFWGSRITYVIFFVVFYIYWICYFKRNKNTVL